jgi:transcriptional regulator with XRE-family HTH domain
MASPYERFLSDLRTLRLAKGLTQGAVAKRLKLSRAQYTAIENGRSTMSFVHLYNLAVILDVQWTIGRKRS